MKIIESKVNKRIAMFYLLAGAYDCSVASCLKEAREIRSSEADAEAIKLRSYLCGDNGQNIVQLEFNRMNDLAMGLLLQGKLREPFGSRWRNARIVRNQVLQEFERLIADFGVDESETYAEFSVSPALPGSSMSNATIESIDYPLKTIVSEQGRFTEIDFPDPDALASITSKNQVPSGYSRIPSDHDAFIWRFMRHEEVLQYSQKVAAYNQLVVDPRFKKQFSGFQNNQIPREMQLYTHLFQRGMPKDFLVIRGYRVEGGCGSDTLFWEFKYYPRRLLVEIVAIENVTGAPVRIDGLLGNLSKQDGLQPIAARGSALGAPSNITGSLGTLPPGGVVLVPLSLIWAPSEEIAKLWKDQTQAPRMLSYSWGARLDIDAVAVDGRTLQLEGRSANFFSVTLGCECGSCPYLYAWDEAAQNWVNSGVMLEFANTAAKITWDWRRFEGAVLHFRIQEDEAELSHIAGAHLEVELFNGDLHMLFCDAFAGVSDETPIELLFNQGVEMLFELPPGMCREDVKSSKLWLRGYYERYTDILAATRSCVFTMDVNA